MSSDYSPSGITKWLHDFPHVDFSAKYVPHTFDPSDEEYVESLGTLAAIVCGITVVSLMSLLLYLCCNCMLSICCGWERKSRERAQLSPRWPIVIQSTLMVGAAIACGMGGIGDSDISLAFGHADDAVGVIQTDVDVAQETATSLLTVAVGATGAVDGLWEDCPTSEVADLQGYVDDVSSYALSIQDTIDGLPTSLQSVQDWIKTIDTYRSLAMAVPLGLVCVCFLVGTIGNCRRSSCLAKTFAACAVWTLMGLGAAVAAELAFSVGSADYCMDPDTFALENVPDDALDVATYYVTCQGTNPVGDPLKDAQTIVDEAFSLVDSLPSAECGQQPIDDLVGNLSYASTAIDNAIYLTNCSSINDFWVLAVHEGYCGDLVPGLFYMWMAQAYCFIALFFSVLVAPVAWRRFSYITPDVRSTQRITVNVNEGSMNEPLLLQHQRAAEQGMAGQHTVVHYQFGRPSDPTSPFHGDAAGASGFTPGIASPGTTGPQAELQKLGPEKDGEWAAL